MTLGLWLAVSTTGWGQSPFDPSLNPEAFLIRDHVEAFTDRNIYVVGESIQFRADYIVEGVDQGTQWSAVLYVDLISASGKSVSKGKFLLSEGMASGILQIPSGILTGNYYLRCYTRWMRNTGPQAYSYTPLKIINPFNAELDNYPNGASSGQSTTRRVYGKGILECNTSKATYSKGETVQVQLSEHLTPRMEHLNCCITVVPSGGIDTEYGQVSSFPESLNKERYRVNYLPDLNGVTLSGKVVRAGGGYPVPFAKLYFSLLGDKPDYLTALTDPQGRFLVSMQDRIGAQELFITPDPSLAGSSEVKIDQDFDTGKLPFRAEKFDLSTPDLEVATRMALQMQLSTVYGSVRTTEPGPQKVSDAAKTLFYGTPGFSILMADFVTLPTLEEVFINLVPDVEVDIKRGVRSLKINSPNSATGFYPPLIMIDHIPVFDQQLILGLDPEKILRIDLINEVYIKGSFFHGGIISIFSKNGDMAGIDLPEGSQFFDFHSLQSTQSFLEPEHSQGDRVPETRNTILWIDDLLLEKGTNREFSFKAPSRSGEYVILVRGQNPRGGVISASTRFKVQ